MKSNPSLAILTADLGYGDAGKGSFVDYLARSLPVHTVCRYNGGAQAAHHVITPDGRQHTFAQFGSGTFVPGVRTHLSRFMLLHPLAMLAEEEHLQALGVTDAFHRLTIDENVLVITPFHQAANRIKEIARGAGRHGSCGMGIGETMSDWLAFGPDVLFARDLGDQRLMRRKLLWLQEAKLEQLRGILENAAKEGNLNIEAELVREKKALEDRSQINPIADLFEYFASQTQIVDGDYFGHILQKPGVTLFEGAQGVLLDEWWGFAPYNSWSTLTFQNADQLLKEQQFTGEMFRLGILRAYATRHGAGPFVSEDFRLTEILPDSHNIYNPWQQQFRVGYLDSVALRYALMVTGKVDGLVVTNLDRMDAIADWKVCDRYRYQGTENGLDAFFQQAGQYIQNIGIPDNPKDIPLMEQRTNMLMQMQPVYTNLPRERGIYLEAISQELHTPVAFISSGPTALDKTRLELQVTALPDLASFRNA